MSVLVCVHEIERARERERDRGREEGGVVSGEEEGGEAVEEGGVPAASAGKGAHNHRNAACVHAAVLTPLQQCGAALEESIVVQLHTTAPHRRANRHPAALSFPRPVAAQRTSEAQTQART